MISIAVCSIGVPFALGFLIGKSTAPILAPGIDSLTYSLFFGVGLAITAVPILGRILREFDLTSTEIGVVAISAAALDDVACWVLLAGISAYASAQFSAGDISLQVGGIVLLGVFSLLVLRRLVAPAAADSAAAGRLSHTCGHRSLTLVRSAFGNVGQQASLADGDVLCKNVAVRIVAVVLAAEGNGRLVKQVREPLAPG